MAKWSWLVALAMFVPSVADANDTKFVTHARTGLAAGYEVLGADPRFTGRLGLGAGFIDIRSGGGLLIDANITGGEDPGLRFVDALRFELSVHLWTPKGAVRFFGGTRLTDAEAGFGGVAYGFPIPIPTSQRTALGVIPEVGVWVGEGAFGDIDALLQVQVLFDFYVLIH
ncbi:MAG: hypothetical protein RMA76_22310 [Deltaproteobacteria bacterium]|jgi:hypothetical protein